MLAASQQLSQGQMIGSQVGSLVQTEVVACGPIDEDPAEWRTANKSGQSSMLFT
jgi:hypothetical protein